MTTCRFHFFNISYVYLRKHQANNTRAIIRFKSNILLLCTSGTLCLTVMRYFLPKCYIINIEHNEVCIFVLNIDTVIGYYHLQEVITMANLVSYLPVRVNVDKRDGV